MTVRRSIVYVAGYLLVVCGSPLASGTPSPSVPVASAALPSASPSATATPSPSVPTYTNAKYGYSVVLPAPYRHSDRLSLDGLSGRPAVVDVFTARTPADELASETNSQTASPSGNYVAFVYVFSGIGSETPRSFYTAHDGSVGESIAETTVDGRPAVKIVDGTHPPVEYIIKDGTRMFRVSYQVYPFFDQPVGATTDKLVTIVESFHFTSPLGSLVGPCTSPSATTREVVDHYLALSTSHDGPAVSECFAASWRAKNPNWDAAMTMYAASGPVATVDIHLVDRVLGCDRYGINVRFPNGASGFFAAVGPDQGTPRIFETGTALLAPEYATTKCE